MSRYPRCVYALKHNKTGRMYIGSTNEIQKRIKSHLSQLRASRHSNQLMQKDYDEHGEDYSFYELDHLEDIVDSHREYEWQKTYKTKDPKYGYNDRDRGGSKLLLPISNDLPEKPN